MQFNPLGENSNGKNKKNHLEENIKDRYARLQDERMAEMKSNINRPPTPDFSLDGSGIKKKQEPQNLSYQSNQSNQMKQNIKKSEMDQFFQPITNDTYTLTQENNSMDKFFNPITNDNFTLKQNIFENFNDPDIITNIDNFTTGIDPNKIKIDEQNTREKYYLIGKEKLNIFIEKIKNIEINLVPKKELIKYYKKNTNKYNSYYLLSNDLLKLQKIKNRWYFNENAVKLFYEDNLNEYYDIKL
jgi:hypothetical protein